MTLDDWLRAHAYLRPLATLDSRIESALAGVETGRPEIPPWEAYSADFGAGVPLLSSAEAAVDLEPMGSAIGAFVERLAASDLPPRLAAEIRRLSSELRAEPRAQFRTVEWLLGDEGFAPSSPGLLRFLGWRAGARYLEPLVAAFGSWRDDERWMRSHCPMCGSVPSMAQLVGTDPGRRRYLACGCCRTRWQYNRTRCPFCEDDSQRIAVIALAGEGGLRVDSCESCKGYLKTLEGQEDASFLLSDWTSLHIDVLARDRGLRRRAGSLYELESAGA